VIDDNKRLVVMLTLGDLSHAGSRDFAAELVEALSSHHG